MATTKKTTDEVIETPVTAADPWERITYKIPRHSMLDKEGEVFSYNCVNYPFAPGKTVEYPRCVIDFFELKLEEREHYYDKMGELAEQSQIQ